MTKQQGAFIVKKLGYMKRVCNQISIASVLVVILR